MTKVGLLNWTLGTYLVFGIFYVFPSGGPQPADLLMAVVLSITTFDGLIRVRKPDVPIMLFLAYTIMISAVWAVILQNMTIYLSSIFFLYNIAVYLLFKKYFSSAIQYNYSILPFIVMALLIQAVYVVFFETVRIRAIGTFTNPNQMSYFALCFCSLGLMISNFQKKIFIGISILFLSWIVVLFGLSKAAMVAMAFQTIIFGLLLKKRKILFILLFMLASSTLYIYFESQITSGLTRIDGIGEDNDDSLAGRGYDRIINEFEYVMFGAGDGVYRRHDSLWKGEIHSSFGTIIFAYGIPGTILFLIFLHNIWRENRVGFILYILPLLIYSLTHNALRYTPFWVCLAACSQFGSRHSGVRNLILNKPKPALSK